jgi:hypothetical protein
LVTFFEVITFFGVAAFFAWLGFLPLIGDQLAGIGGHDLERARANLVIIGDYFLASFLFCATALIADYLFHNGGTAGFPSLIHSPTLLLIIGVFFVAGIVTLLAPIYYIRSIWKGQRDLVTSHPLEVASTLILCYITAFMLFLSWVNYTNIPLALGGVIWGLTACASVLGTILIAKYIHSQQSLRVAIGFILCSAPLWLLALYSLWASLLAIRF